MRHPTETQLKRHMREAMKRSRQDFGIGTIAAVKVRSQSIDLQQLYTPNGRQLRVLEAGNGADPEDIGQFWFVVGYSTVGGPDIVPVT